jgi:hypothetical protein
MENGVGERCAIRQFEANPEAFLLGSRVMCDEPAVLYVGQRACEGMCGLAFRPALAGDFRYADIESGSRPCVMGETDDRSVEQLDLNDGGFL